MSKSVEVFQEALLGLDGKNLQIVNSRRFQGIDRFVLEYLTCSNQYLSVSILSKPKCSMYPNVVNASFSNSMTVARQIDQ